MSFSLTAAKTLCKIAELAYANPKAFREGVATLRMRKSQFLTGASNIPFVRRQNALYDTECFLCHNDKGDIVVAFRGSETEGLFDSHGVFRDWVTTDFDAEPIRYPLNPGPAISVNKGRWVHRGFWNAYDQVRGIVRSKLNDLLDQHSGDSVRVFTTGHSLGGALAIHAGADLAREFKKYDVRTYSFGAPRVGNNDFNDVFESSVKEAYLVAYRGDPVPFTPPIGPNLKLGNKRYKTAKDVVYINNGGETKSKLPPAKVAIRPEDHLLSSYAKALDQISVG